MKNFNTDILTIVRPLLDFIGKYESNGHYDIVWGGRRVLPLTNMNLNEVQVLMDQMLDEQRARRGRAISTAVGKYQIIRRTLISLIQEHRLTPSNVIFDPNTQDMMALSLLNRRGLQRYLSGTIDQHQFALNLAKEWASMPTPQNKSFYDDDDGINSTKVPYSSFIWVVENIRDR